MIAAMSPLWIPLVILAGIALVVAASHGWSATKTGATFDCGIDGCPYRARTNHRH